MEFRRLRNKVLVLVDKFAKPKPSDREKHLVEKKCTPREEEPDRARPVADRLTGRAGSVGEFVEKVGMVGAFDEAIGSRWPVSGGLAQAQLAGTGYRSGLDQVRADAVAAEVSAVPFLASTTAAGLVRRFTAEHIAEPDRRR